MMDDLDRDGVALRLRHVKQLVDETVRAIRADEMSAMHCAAVRANRERSVEGDVDDALVINEVETLMRAVMRHQPGVELRSHDHPQECARRTREAVVPRLPAIELDL